MSTPKSFYLAGPMTGIPQFNFPAFEEAANSLRNRGFKIVSPAELDSPAVREFCMASPDGKYSNNNIAGETWGQMLTRDVRIVADEVDGVVLLPGWENSRGARLEAFVAKLCNKEFFDYVGGGTMLPASRDYINVVFSR